MQSIVVKINGKQRRVSVGISIREMALSLGLTPDSIITVNGQILDKNFPRWIKRGDNISVSRSQQVSGNFLRSIAQSAARNKK